MPININPFYKGQAQARRASMGSRAATPERLAMVAAANHIPGIRVVPVDESKRAILKHPSGARFRVEGSAEWPNDRFTQRRLADGDVKLEEAPAEPASTQNARRLEATGD